MFSILVPKISIPLRISSYSFLSHVIVFQFYAANGISEMHEIIFVTALNKAYRSTISGF